MLVSDFDLIIGVHSIAAAIKNPHRTMDVLFLTDDGKEDLLKRGGITHAELQRLEVTLVSGHKLQEEAKRFFKQLNLEYQRIPSGMFLIARSLPNHDTNWLYQRVENKDGLKILCLDQLSDVHNGAAILRTASFYGVDVVVLPGKNTFGFTPSRVD